MKPSVTRILTTRATPDQVFDHLADFRNAKEWDPGTVSCTLAEGDGTEGSVYRNVSSFMGREATIDYTAVELVRPTRVHFLGRNDQFEGHDVLGIRAAGEGSEVTYHAQFAFSGPARYAAPLVAAYLPFLARKTMRQLQASLDGLAGAR